MIQNSNKRIAVNTAIIYIRLAIVTVVSLLSTRYVLLALGASDYGLYNVVGSVVTMINVICLAMSQTTTRYINVEMGDKDGNLNKIFNICLSIHIGLAVLFFLVIEIVGLLYINNCLNVAPDKLSDARFILHISNIVSSVGLINVPYQGLLNAFEKYGQVALIDILNAFVKLGAVICLMYYDGNMLRFYAVSISVLTFISFLCYHYICHRDYWNIIRRKWYNDTQTFREILYYNNYMALSSVAFYSSRQGTNMIVNFFFGTVVNGAFTISYQIQQFVNLFISNLSTASAPQITQTYAAGETDKSITLCSHVGRYTFLLVLIVLFSLFIHLDYILQLWLKTIPVGTLLYAQWTLISVLCGAGTAGLPSLITAHGNLKWFTYTNSVLQIAIIPIMVLLFSHGFHAEYAIILQCIYQVFSYLITFRILKRLVHLNIRRYFLETFKNPLIVFAILTAYTLLYYHFSINTMMHPVLGILLMGAIAVTLAVTIGITTKERMFIVNYIKQRINEKSN